MNDNRPHVRENLRKMNGNPSGRAAAAAAAGFEYAVQKDSGVVLAERLWRELRRREHACFTLYQRPVADPVHRYQQQNSNTNSNQNHNNQRYIDIKKCNFINFDCFILNIIFM